MHCIDDAHQAKRAEILPPLIKPPSAAPGAPTTAQARTVVATPTLVPATVVPTYDSYQPTIVPPAIAQGRTVVATGTGVEMAEVLIPYQSLHATVVQCSSTAEESDTASRV